MANSGFDVMLQLIRISVRGICEKDGESGSFQNASRFLSFFFWTKFKNYGKMRVAFFSRSRSVSLPRSSGGTLAAGGRIIKIILRSKNYGKMRVAFFSRSRSVTLPRSSGGPLVVRSTKLKKIKTHEGFSPSYTSALVGFPAPGSRSLPYL